MPKAKPPVEQIFRIKVTLIDSEPVIWRQIEVAVNIALSSLHHVIQIVMGWDNSHLHQYYRPTASRSDRVFYGMPNLDWDDGKTLSEDEYGLNDVISRARQRLVYEYDFGDDWKHDLLIEKVLAPEPSVKYPRCVAGERNGPPEDCGGVWGYANLLSILADPTDAEYDDRVEWVGQKFDPEAFNLDAINRKLMKGRW